MAVERIASNHSDDSTQKESIIWIITIMVITIMITIMNIAELKLFMISDCGLSKIQSECSFLLEHFTA